MGVGESGFGYLRQVGLRVVDELQVGRLFTAGGVKRRRSQLVGLRVAGELQRGGQEAHLSEPDKERPSRISSRSSRVRASPLQAKTNGIAQQQCKTVTSTDKTKGLVQETASDDHAA